MATADMPRDDLIRYLREIENRVAVIEQRSPFANTGMSVPAAGTVRVDGNLDIGNLGRITTNAGSLLMKDGANRQLLYAGGLTTNGFGFSLTRTDGSAALSFSDDDPVNELPQILRLFDKSGRALLAEDPTGVGAAWPLAPIPFYGLTWSAWPYNNSATFTAVASATTYKSSARVYVAVQAICDGTATGEVRLMVNGSQVGTTATIGNLALTGVDFGTPAAVTGVIGTALALSVETRVTAGAGKCYATVTAALAWPA